MSLRTPPPSIRREQASVDPLLDSGSGVQSISTATPPPVPQEYNFEPPSYPRPVSVMDQIELFTESFLISCRFVVYTFYAVLFLTFSYRKKPLQIKDISEDMGGLKTLSD